MSLALEQETERLNSSERIADLERQLDELKHSFCTMRDLARLGWRSAQILAVAHGAPATEREAITALAEIDAPRPGPDAVEIEPERLFLILSPERSELRDNLIWWGPKRAGYTSVIRAPRPFYVAGRYTAQEARQIYKPERALPVLARHALALSCSTVPDITRETERLVKAGRDALAREGRS